MYDLAIGQYRDNVQCSFNFKSQLLLQPHFPYASDLVRWAASSLRTIPDYFLADQSAVATGMCLACLLAWWFGWDRSDPRVCDLMVVTEEDIVDYYTIAALGSIPIERNTLSYGFIVASLCSVRVPAERRYECPECRMMLADQLHCNTRSCSQFGRDLGASRSDSWYVAATLERHRGAVAIDLIEHLAAWFVQGGLLHLHRRVGVDRWHRHVRFGGVSLALDCGTRAFGI